MRLLPPRRRIIRLGDELIKLSIALVSRIEENVAPGEQSKSKE